MQTKKIYILRDLVIKHKIINAIINLHNNLTDNASDAANLIIVLGIFRILTESTKQLVGYEFFDANKQYLA